MTLSPEQASTAAKDLIPKVMEDLGVLVSHASVAFPGFPSDPVHAMADATMKMLTEYGFTGVKLLDIPGGYPAIWAEMPAPEGAPTVLLYGHYDVQPAPAKEQGWKTDPWTLTKGDDGRYYGRGAADDKSGIMIHAGAMKLLEGNPGVGIKLVLEGEEETLSHLDEFVEKNPELFQADVMVIADMGNMQPGKPVLTTNLRGDVACTIEVSTLDHAVHSGLFGGPAPDAMVALIKTLATLWDDKGNTLVEGLTSFEWPGAQFPEDMFKQQSGMLDGVEVIGTGTVATKLWGKPNVTVIGMDMPATDHASNILIPSVKARLSMRVAPGEDAAAALDKLCKHLEANVPWGAQVKVEKVKAAPAFAASTDGPAYSAALGALEQAYGVKPSVIGSGGSIPLLSYLHTAAPQAEFILLGAEDMAHARIHGGNESVDPDEIEKMIVAEALLISQLAQGA